MNEEQLEQISLPKWPAMVVVGDTITPEQAAEVIVRTDGFHFSSNDHIY